MIKAVVLDLDGTLLYTLPDIAHAANTALEQNGFSAQPVEAYQYFIGNGIRKALWRAAACPDLPEETLNRIHGVFESIYPVHCVDRTDYYPGIREALAEFARRGVKLGIYTNKTEETAVKVVRHYFAEIPFAFIWGNNATRPLKPDAGGAREFCELMGVAADEVAFVGDSDVDMIFANRGGLLPVGALWGYRGREELLGAGAKLLADTPADLPKIIQ